MPGAEGSANPRAVVSFFPVPNPKPNFRRRIADHAFCVRGHVKESISWQNVVLVLQRRSSAGNSDGSGNSGHGATFNSGETTGRMIVTFRDSSNAGLRTGLSRLQSLSGIASVSRMSDYSAEVLDMEEAVSAGAMMLDHLGIAIVNGDPDQRNAMMTAMSDDEGMVVEAEYINFAMADLLDDDLLESAHDPGQGIGVTVSTPAHLEYLRGYFEAVKHVYETMRASASFPGGIGMQGISGTAAPSFSDNASATWGLQATGVLGSSASGRGIGVAILDTGLDTGHPDFQNRQILTQSFISGETAIDVHGHGTHCTGTSCGPLSPVRRTSLWCRI